MRRIVQLWIICAALGVSDATAQTPYVFQTHADVVSLQQRYDVPSGFERVAVEPGSFGAWLRALPLRTDRQVVHAYDGRRLASPASALIAIDTGKRDLQQCADSIIRLHAEYLWSKGRRDALRYHFTSGDEVRYTDWVRGERLDVSGAKVARRAGERRADSHASLRAWLDLVFMYAGTRSLHRDSTSVAPTDVAPGDFFVAPGSPGHAVIVLDVAVARDGRRKALLAQGFMPAQDMHVIKTGSGVWFDLPDTADGALKTPSWRAFRGAEARRFKR